MIDEVHTLIGAGAAEGAIDAANILKPALARGELQCIGATTLDEYRKHIEKDPALERRFQPVKICSMQHVTELVYVLCRPASKFEHLHIVLMLVASDFQVCARAIKDTAPIKTRIPGCLQIVEMVRVTWPAFLSAELARKCTLFARGTVESKYNVHLSSEQQG